MNAQGFAKPERRQIGLNQFLADGAVKKQASGREE